MQDVEFTVENNKLWILQTRSGKRTSKSAVKIAVDMVKGKTNLKNEAVLRNRSKLFRYIASPNFR